MKALCIVAVALLAACTGPVGLDRVPDDLGEQRSAVVGSAIAQIGTPYRYQGNDRRGFDAAGLVHFVFSQNGADVPRFIDNQSQAGEVRTFDNVRPGDLLFYRLEPPGGGPSRPHVGIYIGDGEMVHAIADRDEVTLELVDNEYWRQRLDKAVAILP